MHAVISKALKVLYRYFQATVISMRLIVTNNIPGNNCVYYRKETDLTLMKEKIEKAVLDKEWYSCSISLNF